MTARTIQKVAAKFAKNDVREIKFTGDPRVNQCVTIRAHGVPSITMMKDSVHKVWVASVKGVKLTFEAPAARKAYQEAVAACWA